MPDNWEQYAVKEDEWDQYATKPDNDYGKKLIPQFVKAGYNYLPFGKRIVDSLPHSERTRQLIEETPQPSNVAANLGAFIGKNAPGIAMSMVGGLGATAPIRNALALGVFQGSQAPAQGKSVAKETAVGAAVGLTSSKVIQMFPKIINLGGRGSAQKIAEKADKSLSGLEKTLQDKYDVVFKEIANKNPNASVPARDLLTKFEEAMNLAPEQQSVLKGMFTRISKLAKDGKNITAQELHNLKQEVRRTIPRSVWNGTQDSDAILHSRRNIYFDIAQKMENLGGDKYKGLTAEYAKFKQAEGQVKSLFYKRGVPSNEALSRSMDVPTQRSLKYLDSQMSKKDKIMQDYIAWKRGQTAKNIAVKVVAGGGALGALGYGLSRQ